MNRYILTTIFLFLLGSIHAQKYMTQNGVISFFSTTPVEDIEAVNNQVSSAIDMDNGNVAAALLMKAFHFEKALMQEHFNEKYVESEKFPKATFKGKIENFEKIIIDHTPVNISLNGKLTIHGVTKEVTATGTLSQLDATHLTLHSTFQVAPEDFGIKIPGAVREKIAKQIDVTVQFDCTKI